MDVTLRAPASPLEHAAKAVAAVADSLKQSTIAIMLVLTMLAAPVAATATPALEGTIAADVGETIFAATGLVADELTPTALAATAAGVIDDVGPALAGAAETTTDTAKAALLSPVGLSLIMTAMLAAVLVKPTRTRRRDGYEQGTPQGADASSAMHIRYRAYCSRAISMARGRGSTSGAQSPTGDNFAIGGTDGPGKSSAATSGQLTSMLAAHSATTHFGDRAGGNSNVMKAYDEGMRSDVSPSANAEVHGFTGQTHSRTQGVLTGV